VRLGPARFSTRLGELLGIDSLDLSGPRLDLWRAPTDNDDGATEPLAPRWREIGLHRLEHRVTAFEVGETSVRIRTRTAPAATDLAMNTTVLWTLRADGSLTGAVEIVPVGHWPVPLPRVGLALELPPELDAVTWDGLGPGESYPDMRRGARYGTHRRSVAELQCTPVHPQENGHRSDVRSVSFRSADGSGLRITADHAVGLTARPWSSGDLSAAAHTTDLVDRGRLFVTLDLAVNGLGTASCGPRELAIHQALAIPRRVRLGLQVVPIPSASTRR